MELSAVEREAAIAALRYKLQPSALRAILKEDDGARYHRHKSVERIIAEVENRSQARLNSRLGDAELPAFLVDLKGSDLLSSRALRKELSLAADDFQLQELHGFPSEIRGRRGRASIANAIAERRWHPGKHWARHFVKVLNLPPGLAGIQEGRTEPAVLIAEPFRRLPELEDFQQELVAGVCAVLSGQPGKNRGILTLPTGAGKTRTAVEALTETAPSEDRQILWIAQSDELCEQAVQAFREVWTDRGWRDGGPREPLVVRRLWGGGREYSPDCQVSVASIQKLHAIFRQDDADVRREELADLPNRLGAIVVDEAHRALAPTYGDVLRFLGIEVSAAGRSAIPILGLTATPGRTVDEETRRLVSRFHGQLLVASVLGNDPVGELRRRSVLSHPVHTLIEHRGQRIAVSDDPRYQSYYETFNDFHSELLMRLGQDAARNEQILAFLMSLPAAWPVLFFGCSVQQAVAMTMLLRRAGRSAAEITSSTRTAVRRHRIEQFRRGELSVLSNYGVLTTGFDAPCVRAVVIGRPTASPVLYEQMIGRGMRGIRFGGTDECLVADVEDNIAFDGQMAYARYASYWSGTAATRTQ